MKNTMKIFVLLAVALLFATSAFADSQGTYGEKVANKLDYGVKNLLGGWMAILPCSSGCDMDSSKEDCCPGVCCVKKVGMGLVGAVTNTVGGALNVVTFPIPAIVPIPNDGIQI